MKQKGSPRFAVEAGFAPILIVVIIAALVGGFLIYQNQTKPVLPVKQVVQPLPKVDETANWKTYSNTKSGFELKYPQNWIIITSEEKGLVYWTDGGSLGERDKILTLEWEVPGVYKDRDSRCDIQKTCDKITEVSTKDGQVIFSIWQANSKFKPYSTGSFSFAFLDKPSTSLYPEFTGNSIPLKQFDQILSTFKFLP